MPSSRKAPPPAADYAALREANVLDDVWHWARRAFLEAALRAVSQRPSCGSKTRLTRERRPARAEPESRGDRGSLAYQTRIDRHRFCESPRDPGYPAP